MTTGFEEHDYSGFEEPAEDADLVDTAWSLAQEVRTLALPAWVREGVSAKSLEPPAAYAEHAGGLFGPGGATTLKRIASVYLRYTGQVLDTKGEIVSRIFHVAKPPSAPEEQVQWRELRLSPTEAVKATRFQESLMKLGDFFFEGTDEDLRNFLAAHGDRPSYKVSDSWGRTDTPEGVAWVFCNAHISGSGLTKLNPSAELGFSMGGERRILDDHLVAGPTAPRIETNRVSSKGASMVSRLLDEVATYFHLPGLIALAWAYAGLARPALIAKNAAFPILMALGSRSSGKTTLLGLLAHAFGTANCGIGAGESTEAGLRRTLARFRCLPIRVDDMRPDAAAKHLASLLSIFDGTSNTRASKIHGRSTVELKPEANLMIACEALPHDAAMLSRAVICTLDPLAKQEQQSFDKNRLYALAADAGVVLLRGFDAKAEMRILVAADAAASGLKQLDERQKYQVWGPVLGSLKVLMELAKVEPADSADVMQHAMAYCREEVMTHSGRGWGEAFFEDLLEMFQADRLKDAHRYFKLDKSGAVLWLNLSGLFTQWHEYRARQARGTFLASVDLRRDLKSLRWVMFPKDQKKIRVGEKTVNAVGVKLDVAPEYVKQLARSV